MDVWGPAPIAARGGHRYFLLIVDDHTRYVSVHLLHTKVDAPEAIMRRAVITPWYRSLAVSSATPTHHSLFGGMPSTMPPSSTIFIRTRISPIPLPPRSGSGKHPLLALFASGGAPPMSSSTLRLGGGKVANSAPRLKHAYLGHNADSPDYLFLNPSTQQLVRSRDVVFDETRPFYSTSGEDPPSGPPSLVWADFDAPPALSPPPAPSPPTSHAIAPSPSEVSDPTSPVSSAAAPPSPPSPTFPTAPPLPSARITYHRRSNPPAPPPPPVPTSTQELALPPSPELITYQRRPLPPTRPPKPSPPGTPAPPSSPVAHGTRSHRPVPPLALAIRCSVITPTPPAGGGVPSTFLEDRHEELCDLHAVIPQLSHIFLDITESPSLNFSENPTIPIPLTVQGALSGPHAAEWRAAMEAECEAFTRNHSFDDETPPLGVNIVGGKWLFRVKQLPDEAPVFKGRYVAKGFTQHQSFDFFKHYLGMEITRDRQARTISLSQEFYINNVLKHFEMELCTPMATLLPLQHLLTAPAVPTPEACSEPYPELVGSLMYAMMCTRPDLAYPGTKSHVLTLGSLSPPRLECYTDSSWADDQTDRHSSQGYCFTLGNGDVSWRSTRLSAVSLSSCEAELYAGTMAAQEARWLTFILQELGYPQPTPTLWCDNKSTIHLSQDPVYHTRTKHNELRHFFIRDLVQREHLNVEYVASHCNLADLFTKPLGKVPHHRLLGTMGLCAPPSPP
ncbi:unnamed protein product [Closterium sp. NIES-53]